jgi:hypothetical protein
MENETKYFRYKMKYIKYKQKYLMLKHNIVQFIQLGNGFINNAITVKYQIIKTFANENAHKLFINPDNKYDKNIDNFNLWIDKIKQVNKLNDSTILFAMFLRDNMRYISFQEFHTRIINMAKELTQLLMENNYDEIYFGIESDHDRMTIYKSNLWVLLLAILEMDLPDEITQKIETVFQIEKMMLRQYKYYDKIKKYLFVFFDDMSYSGLQQSDRIEISGLCEQPEQNIHLYLFIPYISNTAKKLFEKNHFELKYFHNTEFIESLQEQLTRWGLIHNKNSKQILDDVCPIDKNIELDMFDCSWKHGGRDKIPVYFEHKMADGVSTFNTVLKSGPYITHEPTPNINYLIPLINNCTDPATICPPTFYKTIQYTYNKNIIINYAQLIQISKTTPNTTITTL